MSDVKHERWLALRRKLLRQLGVPLLACLIAAGAAKTNWLESLEYVYYDYWHLFAGVRYTPEHTAFVSMDDETLVALKDDPLASAAYEELPRTSKGAFLQAWASNSKQSAVNN